MKKTILSLLCLLTTAIGAFAADTYTLVTDASKLADGDKIIIAYATSNVAMSATQGDNNRSGVTVTFSSDKTTLTSNDDVQVITLEAVATTDGSTQWNFAVGDSKYLYAASSKKNYLRSAALSTASTNANATISIASASADQTTIKFNGSNSNNQLQYTYNNNNHTFSCYSTNQKLVSIYKLAKPNAPTITDNGDNTVSITAADGCTIYYTTDGTEPTTSSTKYEDTFAFGHSVTEVKAIAVDSSNNISDVTTVAVSYKSSVESPTIEVDGNQVTITAGDGLTVYYTTNGSTPSNESTKYAEPFEITEGCTVKAIAYDSNNDMSGVTAKDVEYCRVATPSFKPSSAYVEAGTAVTITCATEGATIYYTLNGGNAQEYTAETVITVTEATTLTAYATLAHYAQSETATQSYQIGKIVEKTSFLTPTTLGGITGNSYSIRTYADEATGATYYTNAAGAYASGTTTSGLAPAFGINKDNGGIVTTISPGTVSKIIFTQYSGQTTTKSVNIYGSHTAYTSYARADIEETTKLNGETAVTLTPGSAVTFDLSTLSESYEYIAIVSTSGATQFSEIQVVWNVFVDPSTIEVANPEISNDGNLVTITAGEGATIYYTLDGTDPTTESTLYEGAFSISENCTVSAIATANGGQSQAVSKALTYCKVATPTFSLTAGPVLNGATVAITTTTADAKVQYSTDGSNYSDYSEPIAITAETTLYAKATRNNYADSEEASASYTIGEAVEYTLVNSTDRLINGAHYLITSDEAVAGAYTNNYFNAGFAFAKDGNSLKVATGSNDVTEFMLETADSGWYLKTTAGKYVIYNSGTSITLKDATTTNGVLNISFEGSTANLKFNATDNNTDDNTNVRYLAYNTNPTRFASYTSANVYLYILNSDIPTEPEQPEEPEQPASKEMVFDFSTSSDMTNGNIKLDLEGNYDENYQAYLVAESGYSAVSSFTDDDQTIGIKSIAFTVKNPTKNEDFAYKFNANDVYEVTIANKFNDKGELASYDPDKLGTFKIDDDGNMSWTATSNSKLISKFAFANENQVVISKIEITWDYVTPVIIDCTVDGTKVTFSTLKGHKVYYRKIATPTGSTAPAQVSTRRSGESLDSQDDEEVNGVSSTTTGNEAEYLEVKDGTDGWTVTDTTGYACDFSGLENGESYEIKIENGDYSIVGAFGKNDNGDVVTGIAKVIANAASGVEEWYNLQGVRIANPTTGIFIHRVGNRVEKVVLK